MFIVAGSIGLLVMVILAVASGIEIRSAVASTGVAWSWLSPLLAGPLALIGVVLLARGLGKPWDGSDVASAVETNGGLGR